MAPSVGISTVIDRMTNEVKRVVIQTRAPRGADPGRIAEGFYVVVDNSVVMTDQDGKPVGEKHHLGPKDDPRPIACMLTRRRRCTAGPINSFDGPIRYPTLKF